MTTGDRESGTRARTRRAILDAAVRVLSHNPTASLGDIAADAAVGRTTVHRYFQERSDLMRALSADALDQIGAATERARIAEGDVVEALVRLCHEYFDMGELLMLMFSHPQLTEHEFWSQDTAADISIENLISGGIADGRIDPKLTAGWIHELMWSMLYTAWESVRTGKASKYEALELVRYTLRKTVSAD